MKKFKWPFVVLASVATSCVVPHLGFESDDEEDTDNEPLGGQGGDRPDDGPGGDQNNLGGSVGGDDSVDTPDCVGDECPSCEPEEDQRCLDGNTPQACNQDGQWVTLDDCSGDRPLCMRDSGECGCIDNELRCTGGSARERCISGVWTSISDCGGSTPACDGDGTCVACVDGQPDRCSADHTAIQECNQNGWTNKQTCNGTDGGVCEDGACTTTALSPNLMSCGDSYCETGEVCCSNDPGSAFCAATADACPAQQCTEEVPDEVTITCDGPSDCPEGQLCCSSQDLDDGCGVYPAAIKYLGTHCANDCLGTDEGGYYREYEVCTGPAGCSVGGVLPCTKRTLGHEEMYTCDVYSWMQP